MIFKNFLRLLKTGVFQTIATILLLSFFIFLQNILLSLTASMYSFSGELKNKLWVYLYFKEWEKIEQVQENRDLIIDLKTNLEKAWLSVQYLSKDDAIKTLSKRLPKIIDNFEKYGIKNPIPPTMYIIFRNDKEYEAMRKIVSDPKYQEIILNISDIWTTKSFKEQESRVKKIISFSNFLTKFYVYISIALFVSILWFLVMVIKINFYSFYAQIEVEKLIWFSYWRIIFPFLLYVIFIILFAFLFSMWYLALLVTKLQVYFVNTFDFNLMSLIWENIHFIKLALSAEFGFTLLLSLIVSYLLLLRLIRKI